jgi:hypothetical protein
MGRRSKLSGKTKEYLENAGKGRKNPWQPRGQLIPPNRVHTARNGPYRRDKFDWKELLAEG